MSLAAKIRRFDPEKNRSVDVAERLGCHAAYVRTVWQRMAPEKQVKERQYKRTYQHDRYHRDPEYRARRLAEQRAFYARKKLDPARGQSSGV